ncbi:MAG: hypothetical protein R3C26_11950 [Calditrichia bacterium]
MSCKHLAIPEVFLTAYQALYWLGGIKSGDNVLIHAGASGVGTAAIQLVRGAGGVPFVTAGSAKKLVLHSTWCKNGHQLQSR